MQLKCNVCGLLVFVAVMNDDILQELADHVNAHYEVPAKFEVMPDDYYPLPAIDEVALLEALFKLEDPRDDE